MANDKIHDAVVQALKNDGWHILREHFNIRYEELEIRIDIAAEHSAILIDRAAYPALVKQALLEYKTSFLENSLDPPLRTCLDL